MPTLVTERELAAFRRDHLAPNALLGLVEQHVAVLVSVAVGVGKSHAIDDLLQAPETFERFDLVFCVAPTWRILNERRALSGEGQPVVEHLVIEPRPTQRCGERNSTWMELEGRGCGALAKQSLCLSCPHYNAVSDPCRWPDRFERIREVGLVFATDAQLKLNPSLIPFLLMLSGKRRPLIILDEGQLLDSRFEAQLEFEDIDRFEWACREVVAPSGLDAGVYAKLQVLLTAVRDGRLRRLPADALDTIRSVSRSAVIIQKYGVQRFEREFRFIGHDLQNLVLCAPRWRRREASCVRFTARPYLRRHLLLLSAHLSPLYVAHRLGQTAIHSPFQGFRFQHSGTSIFNLRTRSGADAYFLGNHRSILDTFAVAIARNIALGKTTVLVARKKSKAFCADYLSRRLAGWGHDVRIIVEGALPEDPSPTVVPLIHYGVVGVNDYERYDSLYCVNSYYISSRVLTRTVLEFDPDLVRVELSIVGGPERHRRVRAGAARRNRASVESLGDEYLRRLELDPVLQVVGRVRFATQPREVVVFHLADLSEQLPGVVEVRTPTALRSAMGLPQPSALDRDSQAQTGRVLMEQGMTAAAAAKCVGVSRRTLFRRMEKAESAKSPTEDSSYRRFGTLADQSPSSDGGVS